MEFGSLQEKPDTFYTSYVIEKPLNRITHEISLNTNSYQWKKSDFKNKV